MKPSAKSEPDFLAFSTAGQIHVLESKGRAEFNSYGVTDKEINAARNKALRQVCKIATVNGLRPVTRTACVFAFDQSGLAGQITDPPETRSYHYVAEWPQLIRQAYAIVLDPLFENAAVDIGGSYMGIEFMPGWRFGIDRHVYKLVRSIEDAKSAGRLLSYLTEFRPDEEGTRTAEEQSVGGDGFILIGGLDYSEKNVAGSSPSVPHSARPPEISVSAPERRNERKIAVADRPVTTRAPAPRPSPACAPRRPCLPARA